MTGGGAAPLGRGERGRLLQSLGGVGGLEQGGCAGQPLQVPHCSPCLRQGCGWVGMGEGGSSGMGGLSGSPP